MIPTDWAPPMSSVLGRLSDRRVQQYWDPNHALARQMQVDARAPQPTPDCCERNGVLWDLAAVYPKGRRWDKKLPAATIFNGPVVEMADEIEAALVAPEGSRSPVASNVDFRTTNFERLLSGVRR